MSFSFLPPSGRYGTVQRAVTFNTGPGLEQWILTSSSFGCRGGRHVDRACFIEQQQAPFKI
uniref:Uncharacterized protein n=1 Tax=Oryza nivara TaxID=4536 RepID=A0A0E0FZL3_ORYNI